MAGSSVSLNCSWKSGSVPLRSKWPRTSQRHKGPQHTLSPMSPLSWTRLNDGQLQFVCGRVGSPVIPLDHDTPFDC